MDQERLAPAITLSIVIGILIAVASAGGLLIEGLYRNNLWATSQFRGSDLVRLAVVVPLLFGSLHLVRRGSTRGLLLWLGILWLTVYDYAFYLFGAAFNALFLIYVALFSLSILALLSALPHVDADAVARRFRATTPVGWIGGYLLLIAVFLGGLWTAQALAFVVTGRLPPSLVASGHITEIVFALDLALLVPGLVLAAVWIWRRRPWGYVLGAMMLVKGTLYPAALLGMGVFAERAGVPDAGGMTAFWVFFFVASAAASATLFWNLRPAEAARAAAPTAPSAGST
jgi:hypothetical protein